MSTQSKLVRTIEILIKQLTIADQNFTTINDQLIIIKGKFETVDADIKALKDLEKRPLKLKNVQSDLQEIIDAIPGWEPSPEVVAKAIVKAFPNISLGIKTPKPEIRDGGEAKE